MVLLSFASREQVVCFIKRFGDAIAEGYKFALTDRQKNRDTLTKLGMNYKDVRLQLMLLSIEHYVLGPEEDNREGHSGSVWIFRLPIKMNNLYVKVKLLADSRRIICLSFHEQEYEMNTIYAQTDVAGGEVDLDGKGGAL